MYFDRNGKEIKEGNMIRDFESGLIEKVLNCGDGELGINATNWNVSQEPTFFPLWDCSPEDWEVIADTEEEYSEEIQRENALFEDLDRAFDGLKSFI